MMLLSPPKGWLPEARLRLLVCQAQLLPPPSEFPLSDVSTHIHHGHLINLITISVVFSISISACDRIQQLHKLSHTFIDASPFLPRPQEAI